MLSDHPSATCPGCAGLATVTERTQNLTGWQSKQNGQLGKLVDAIGEVDDKLEHYISIAEVRMTALEKSVTAHHAVAEAEMARNRWSWQMTLMSAGIFLSFVVATVGLFTK